jgi:hypothetical protein
LNGALAAAGIRAEWVTVHDAGELDPGAHYIFDENHFRAMTDTIKEVMCGYTLGIDPRMTNIPWVNCVEEIRRQKLTLAQIEVMAPWIEPPRDRTTCCAVIRKRLARSLIELRPRISLPVDWTLTWAFTRLRSRVYWVDPPVFGHGSVEHIYRSGVRRSGAVIKRTSAAIHNAPPEFDPSSANMNASLSLLEIFQQHNGRLIDKWEHYLPIYERHFAPFRHRPVRILEIGVFHGGSLQMWKRYFGSDAAIVGVDLDPRCAEYTEDGIDIHIGDQGNPAFWNRMAQEYVDFDIVIDDGSHMAGHQKAAFLSLWPHVRDGGIYLVEDCHTAYFSDYGGGVGAGGSFIDFAKQRIDDLHAFWLQGNPSLPVTRFTREIGAMTFHDSVVVFEKAVRAGMPARLVTGELSRPVPDEVHDWLNKVHIRSTSRRP